MYAPPPGPPPPARDPVVDKKTKSYLPPPGPPPGFPHLVVFPFLSPDQLPTLYSQGWARVSLPSDHPLLSAAVKLFSASHNFFAMPLEHKEQFHLSKLGEEESMQSSEEGWSRVAGEKEMLTVRRMKPLCPPDLVPDAQDLWNECGSFMQLMMASMEQSLNLPKGAFDSLVKEECVPPKEKRHETLLRMFRYERAEEAKLVAAHHRDIGLLSLVIGSSPGLEVWDESVKQWIAIEENGEENPPGGLTLTFMTGKTFTRLTNNRYRAGLHRVFVPPAPSSSSNDDAKYRYSLVYALRPYREAMLTTDDYTSDVTGPFEYPFEGVKAQTLFNAIASAHWSVNGDIKERVRQRLKVQKMKEEVAREYAIGARP